eukprot:TRINITY_DN7262_c0_g1_i1.p1 TRINITY_DN7262_c0_g1~~TRINITY_DN7262_c0_g1_i1.p1  ORF type:complete len:147 (-),score=23.29 TRINITY_DN7262_c0_g1_i1:110-550(-)
MATGYATLDLDGQVVDVSGSLADDPFLTCVVPALHEVKFLLVPGEAFRSIQVAYDDFVYVIAIARGVIHASKTPTEAVEGPTASVVANAAAQAAAAVAAAASPAGPGHALPNGTPVGAADTGAVAAAPGADLAVGAEGLAAEAGPG